MRCRKKAADSDFSSPGPKASGEGAAIDLQADSSTADVFHSQYKSIPSNADVLKVHLLRGNATSSI